MTCAWSNNMNSCDRSLITIMLGGPKTGQDVESRQHHDGPAGSKSSPVTVRGLPVTPARPQATPAAAPDKVLSDCRRGTACRAQGASLAPLREPPSGPPPAYAPGLRRGIPCGQRCGSRRRLLVHSPHRGRGQKRAPPASSPETLSCGYLQVSVVAQPACRRRCSADRRSRR